MGGGESGSHVGGTTGCFDLGLPSPHRHGPCPKMGGNPGVRQAPLSVLESLPPVPHQDGLDREGLYTHHTHTHTKQENVLIVKLTRGKGEEGGATPRGWEPDSSSSGSVPGATPWGRDHLSPGQEKG